MAHNFYTTLKTREGGECIDKVSFYNVGFKKKKFACFHQSSNEQSHEEKNGEEKLLPEDKRRI